MITLTRQETELVLATLDIPRELRDRLAAEPERVGLNGNEIELLVELATDRLMTRGFDADYRPTVEGAALERLIDRLFAEDVEENSG